MASGARSPHKARRPEIEPEMFQSAEWIAGVRKAIGSIYSIGGMKCMPLEKVRTLKQRQSTILFRRPALIGGPYESETRSIRLRGGARTRAEAVRPDYPGSGKVRCFVQPPSSDPPFVAGSVRQLKSTQG